MRKTHFSLLALTGAVFVAAANFALIHEYRAGYPSAAWLINLNIFLICLPLIGLREDNARAFWIGFGVFGWLALALLFDYRYQVATLIQAPMTHFHLGLTQDLLKRTDPFDGIGEWLWRAEWFLVWLSWPTPVALLGAVIAVRVNRPKTMRSSGGGRKLLVVRRFGPFTMRLGCSGLVDLSWAHPADR